MRFRAWRIEVVDGPDKGKVARLERGSLIVGSAADADLVLADGAVSRAHARLVPFPDGVEVQDLGSKNGTHAAGARIDRARLPAGATLVLGHSSLRLIPEDGEARIEPSEHTRFGLLHGRSLAMRELFALMEVVAPKDAPLLIEGEAGSGKSRAARSIHEVGAKETPFTVFEGPEIESFEGRLDSPGTVVVEDVDALSPNAQRSLRAELERARSRLITTTSLDLDREAAAGRFDRALLLALASVRLRIPPLRERASDLPLLIEEILEELGHPAFELGPADLGRLEAYGWPDNVRELRSVIEGAVSLEQPPVPSPRAPSGTVVGAELPYKQARAQMIEAFEREYVRALLAHHDGNVSRAARAAGIDRVYLHRLIRKYGF